ncbi:MAG: hypothetical protein SGJ00_06085 [bacterium]|nr:hypothetical protein [bacterium]
MTKTIYLFLFLTTLISCNHKMQIGTNLPSHMVIESFYWEKAEINGRVYDKAAMFVPINIDHLKQDIFAQFDLGSNTSILYEKNLRSIKEFSHLKLDTLPDGNTDDGKKIFVLRNVNLSIGKIDLGTRDIYGFFNYGYSIGIDKSKGFEEKSIGTIGSDIVQNKYLIINFPAKKISISDSLNYKTEQSFNFVTCKLVNNRIIVPLEINGKIKYFLYDTGASLFPMSTSKSIWTEITDNKINNTLNITNFGKPVQMLSAKSNLNVKIAGRQFKNFEVYHERNNFFDEIFKQIECDGIIGNSFFFDKVICIDYKTKRFGIEK